MPLVWFVLALLRVRNAPLFAVTAAIALADMLPYSRVGRWLAAARDAHEPPAPVDLAGVRPSCRSLVVWRRRCFRSAESAAGGRARLGAVRSGLLARRIAAPTRRNQSLRRGWDARIFNDLNFGGFLIYYEPRLRVFVDDRCSLYGAEFLRAYDHARREDPAEIDRWQRQYGFRYALVETGGPFDRYLSSAPAWTPLGRTPAATLYQRHIGVPATIR